MCLLTRGHITVLAPQFLGCTTANTWTTAAGPAMNILAGVAAIILLRVGIGRSDSWRYFFWLSFVFNALIAAGYLLIGAVTSFGDWADLLAFVKPAWVWRVPATFLSLYLYRYALFIAGRELAKLNGVGIHSNADYLPLIFVPLGAAAVVAVGRKCMVSEPINTGWCSLSQAHSLLL
jgi:hypothetical protein